MYLYRIFLNSVNLCYISCDTPLIAIRYCILQFNALCIANFEPFHASSTKMHLSLSVSDVNR